MTLSVVLAGGGSAGHVTPLLALAAFGSAAERPPQAMNDIQVIGSHNSFKARIPAAVMARLRAADPKLAEALDYYHLPLTRQLDAGVRQLEIDVFADPEGGRYADPKGEGIARAAAAIDRGAATATLEQVVATSHHGASI